MKKFLLFLCGIFLCAVCHSETLDISWYVDGNVYTTTQCNSGGDLILPTPPSKPGYNFVGWRNNFQLVEYLESTGTQYIDTGIVPTINTGVKIQAAYTTWPLNDFDTIIGSRDGVGGNNIRFYPLSSRNEQNTVRQDYGVSEYQQGFDRNIHTIDFNDSQHRIIKDGATIGTLNVNDFVGNNTSMYLFCANIAETAEWCSAARIYFLKIYDNDTYTLVRDFVPVIDAAGVPCMWDKVSETFFYNQGTGNFIAGPVVEE